MAYVVIIHATFADKAHADHVYNQTISVATNASVAHIGQPDERTSHGFVAEEQANGSLSVLSSFHKDLFGIIRNGEPSQSETPQWIQPTGGHDAYPAKNIRGGDTYVTHDNKTWRNTHGNGNIWAPGAFGWTEVAE